ncbi:MAG: hypothetical protein KDD82_07045 [Planctomycetes bacterium]|nr:hypothetical protein [Planctomycetota bacterium]
MTNPELASTEPNQPGPADSERGTALLVSLILISLLVIVGGAVALASQTQSAYSLDAERRSMALVIADNGIAKAKVRLLEDLASGTDAYVLTTPSDATPVQTFTEDQASVEVYHVLTVGSRLSFRIRSRGTFSTEGRTVEILISGTRNTTPSQGPGLAAVLTNGDIDVTGNILIDGQDHYADGTSGGAGVNVDGVKVVDGTLSWTGNPTVGGNSTSPNRLDAGDEGSTFTNNDTTFDLESIASGNPVDDTDGDDDDGDGWTDEDGFPGTVGEFVGQPDEIGLRTRAQNDGTYFTNKGDYDAWLGSTTPAERGGKVIYLEVPVGSTLGLFKLPNNPPPAEPSIVIVQAAPAVPGTPPVHSVEVGPVHVMPEGARQFQGLFMTDVVKNTNGNGTIVGAVVSFGDQTGAKKPHFGNGGADILFSSEVLANLPGVDNSGEFLQDTETWREVR